MILDTVCRSWWIRLSFKTIKSFRIGGDGGGGEFPLVVDARERYF